jgi:hypothetical protein
MARRQQRKYRAPLIVVCIATPNQDEVGEQEEKEGCSIGDRAF